MKPDPAQGLETTLRLAHHVIDTRFEELTHPTIAAAKLRVADIVGCATAGSQEPDIAALRDHMVRRGGIGRASIIGSSSTLPASDSAYLNSLAARSHDFGVLIPYVDGRPAWSHISESTVPAAIACAEEAGATGAELLAALIVGDDIATRLTLGASYTPGAGWDSPGLVNKFAVVAIAARLHRLSPIQLVDAWGLVLNQLGGTFQAIDSGSHAFKLAQGLAARDGIEAVELAQLGWTAGEDPLFGPNGFIDMYCDGVDFDPITRDLGVNFYGDATFKPYPACRFVHSSIDCALALAPELVTCIDRIESIMLDVAPMHLDSPLARRYQPSRFPKGDATFSLQYAVASALLRGRATINEYTGVAPIDPTVAAVARKVQVTGGRSAQHPEAAALTVNLGAGNLVSIERTSALGHPLDEPLTVEQIRAKFIANCEYGSTLSREAIDNLWTTINDLERTPLVASTLEPLRRTLAEGL